MPAIVLPFGTTQQPVSRVRANPRWGPSHLVNFANGNPRSGWLDVVTGLPVVWGGTGSAPGGYQTTGYGGLRCLKFDDAGTGDVSSKKFSIGSSAGSGAPASGTFKAFSILYYVKLGSVSGTIDIYGSTSGGNILLRTFGSELRLTEPAVADHYTTSGAGLSTSAPTMIGLTYDGATIKFFKNGVVVGSSSLSFDLAGSAQHSLYQENNGEIYCFATFPYALPDSAISALSANVWQLFGASRVYFFPSAGGGGTTITPTGLYDSAFGSFSVRVGKRTISFTGKATEEAFGSFLVKSRNTLTFSGKSSDSTIGNFNVFPGRVFIYPNSKDTDGSIGSSSILSGQNFISPSSKVSDSAIGSFIVVSGDRILLINGVSSGSAFGSHSLIYAQDQTIVFSGKEYLEFGQFLLSGSAVVRAMHFFDWISQQPGLTGSLNDKLYQYLRSQGFTSSTPTMLFLWLRSLGYTGNTASMLTAFERDYTSRWH